MKNKTKDKTVIPTYQMESDGFYLLLRVRMEKKGCRNINGVGEAFFKSETYQDSDGILAKLCKRDILSEQQGTFMIREGLEKALDIMLDSPHCMNFQNELLHKKGQILSFYYANGAYVGVLLGQKNSMLVMTAEEDALYKAFEKQLENAMVSSAFQPELWNALWHGKDAVREGEGVSKPRREARITHSGNCIERERFNIAMVADGRRIQIIRGADSLPCGKLNRETADARDWYGVICRELERLKVENQGKGADSSRSGSKSKETSQKKSEYQQTTAAPDFPKSGVGFIFWSLKRVITGFPKMFLSMIRRKSLALLLYPLWGVILFLYNMYITCYYNDTFMLDRRARLGNLSPYLMAATLWTPSSLKGLQMKWGLINTSFLVWPLMMVLTLLFRHLILQLGQRKAHFFGDLVKIPAAVRDCAAQTGVRRKDIWIAFALVWALGFLVMNPITMFLAAVLLLLWFAQGRENSLVQMMFLWACAKGRKKIDAGQKPEPSSRKYRLLLFYGSLGLTIYGFASVLLWFVVDYNWWMRLVLTVLMVLFALLQIFMPGAFSGKLRSRTAVFLLSCFTILCVAAILGNNTGVVFADDGGWSESGRTIAGLAQNAGFSTILGISLLTIGLGVGLPLMAVGIVSLGAGIVTFAVGTTDTAAGNYVKKSARQYFFGPEERENKTVFCTITEGLNFFSGFANPTAGMTGTTLKVFQGGKLVGDVVSTIGDLAGTFDDIGTAIEENTLGNWGALVPDGVGLVLDFCGIKDDYKDFKKVLKTPGIRGGDLRDASFREQRQEIQNSQRNEMEDMTNTLDRRIRMEVDAENTRHQNKMNEIQNDMRRVENGEITPPAGIDREDWLRELNRTMEEEVTHDANVLSEIRDKYRGEMWERKSEIDKKYSQEKRNLIQKMILDKVDKINSGTGEIDNFWKFWSTNDLIGADYLKNTDLYQMMKSLSDTEVDQLLEQLSGFLESGLEADE